MADTESSGGNRHVLLIAGAAAFVLMLLALTVSLVLVFALRSDVAALEDQARRSAKAAKAMQEEIAGLREAAATLAAQRRPARPQNIDAADTSADCVVGAGNKAGLPDCMKLGAGQ